MFVMNGDVDACNLFSNEVGFEESLVHKLFQELFTSHPLCMLLGQQVSDQFLELIRHGRGVREYYRVTFDENLHDLAV